MDAFSTLAPGWRSVMMGMVVAVLIACGIALVLRRVEARAARPLGAFLILAGLSVGPQVIGYTGAYQAWPWLTFFPLFFVDLWLGPLLILHTHHLIRGGPSGWRVWLLLPGALQSLYYTGAFLLPGDGLFDTAAKWAFNDAVHDPYVVPLETLVGIALLVCGLVYLWRERRAYLAFLEANTSTVRDHDPVWLRNIVVASLAAGALYVGLGVADLVVQLSYTAVFPVELLIMVVLTWLGLDAAWRLTQTFPKIADPGEAATAPDDLGARVLERLESEDWYLEPRLSIREVAARMGTNESYVSRAVNARGRSFNRTVNGLRVDHAKGLLAGTDMPVLGVALDSGFNSKATFNRVFRDMTGQTPSRFRHTGRASQNP